MLSKSNWDETKNRWDAYWKCSNTGTPLMCVVAAKPGARDIELEKELAPRDMEDRYLNAERITARYGYYVRTHEFLADSFPNISLDFGPGSMAGYLGSEIIFKPGTVWFEKCLDSWEGVPELRFDPENMWFKRHIQLFNDVRSLAGDDYYLTIPDIMENLDVLASLRGAQDLIYDMIDEPDEVLARVDQVQDLYWKYYDAFYDIAKLTEDGLPSSAYTVFQIWGRGKTLKLQCDFSAMMSPRQFDYFVLPALRRQSSEASQTLYHLDGPDAIKHLPSLMSVEGINALQWTSGSYNPDGTCERWFPIYDQVRRAGKSLWIQVYGGSLPEQIMRIDTLIRRYGSRGIFMCFGGMTMRDAEGLLNHAERNWKDVEGTFK